MRPDDSGEVVRALARRASIRLLASVFVSLIAGCLSALQIALITKVVGGTPLTIWVLLGAAFAVFVTMSASKILSGLVTERLAAELRGLFFRRIIAMKFRKAEELGAQRMLATLQSDIEAVTSSSQSAAAALTNLFLLLAGIGFATYVQPRLALVALVVGAPVGVLHVLLARKVTALFAASRDPHVERMYELTQFLVNGLAKLKVNARTRTRVVAAFELTLEAVRRLRSRAWVLLGFSEEMGRFVFFFVFVVVLGVAPQVGATQRETADFAFALLYIFGPLDHVVGTVPNLSQGWVAFGMLSRLELAPDESSSDESARVDAFRAIQLRDVEVTYEGEGGFHLGPLSLDLRPSSVTIITGGNGGGKSTLLKIIAGLYSPEHGKLLWDGKDVDDDNRGAYRSLFSLVLREDALVADALPSDAPSAEDPLCGYLSPKPDYDPKKPGASRALSHGQRSRLALWEAWTDERPILLLDEWAADQDPMRRRFFYREFVPALRARGKCVVIISHDDAYFDCADERLHLDRGQVARVYGIDDAGAAKAAS